MRTRRRGTYHRDVATLEGHAPRRSSRGMGAFERLYKGCEVIAAWARCAGITKTAEMMVPTAG